MKIVRRRVQIFLLSLALLITIAANLGELPVVMYQGAFVVMTFVLELFFLRDREEIAFLRTLDFDSGRKINGTSVVSWVLWYFWAIAFVNNVAAPPVWGFSSRSASGGM